ncbi:hypothetical protein EIP86_003415 [Pleurotus ostreatoroseus]|nr:hypothetical protein EIP86_003415 [Pleurotus ostreatoroseus]
MPCAAPLPSLKILQLGDLHLPARLPAHQPFQVLALSPLWTSVEFDDIAVTSREILPLDFVPRIQKLMIFNHRFRSEIHLLHFLPNIADLVTLECFNYALHLSTPLQALVNTNRDTLRTLTLDLSADEKSDDSSGLLITFVQNADSLEQLTLSIPLYDWIEIDHEPGQTPHSTALSRRILMDAATHVPRYLDTLRIHVSTIATSLPDWKDFESRMALNWKRAQLTVAAEDLVPPLTPPPDDSDDEIPPLEAV